MSHSLALLQELRTYGGARRTVGLDDATIERFVELDPDLGVAIDRAHAAHIAMRAEWGAALAGDEAELVEMLQEDLVNFYAEATINPYVPLAALGPWIVTTHGAVVHDNGGYGMLGAGHAPELVLDAMAGRHVMANVMTANFSQKRLADRLRREVGQTRDDGCPFARFICMNSGSEAVTVALRISDVLASAQTGPGGRFEGWKPVFLAVEGGFHGRTGRPAQVSGSTLGSYRKHLKSFSERDNCLFVPPNDVDALRAAFARADAEHKYIEAVLIEPVMGEGNPGMSVSRAFYDEARRLTAERGTFLVCDSIQAGLRGTGYLSVVDYPGFSDCDPPDMETWSKALNAGQYPLSVLGMSERAADRYVRGIYGNTMTTNPRALEVACAVLDGITPALRENIRARGDQLVAGLKALQLEFPDQIRLVQGTGLLASAEITTNLEVVGMDGLEVWCRLHGLGVIHGGANALRLTPHFAIRPEEIDLILEVVRQAIRAKMPLEIEARVPVQIEATRSDGAA